jgi:hypothetical protein
MGVKKESNADIPYWTGPIEHVLAGGLLPGRYFIDSLASKECYTWSEKCLVLKQHFPHFLAIFLFFLKGSPDFLS